MLNLQLLIDPTTTQFTLPGEEQGNDKDHRDRGRDEGWKSLLECLRLARDARAIALNEPLAHLTQGASLAFCTPILCNSYLKETFERSLNMTGSMEKTTVPLCYRALPGCGEIWQEYRILQASAACLVRLHGFLKVPDPFLALGGHGIQAISHIEDRAPPRGASRPLTALHISCHALAPNHDLPDEC